MASSKNYYAYILEQLSGLEDITGRAMMGEYILCYRGRIVGGIYDDRLLVKPVTAAEELLPEAPMESPYPGAKPMLLVEEVDDRALLENLFRQMWEQLPPSKPKRTKRKNEPTK